MGRDRVRHTTFPGRGPALDHTALMSIPPAIDSMPQFGVMHWSFLVVTVLCAVVAVPVVRLNPRVLTVAGWILLLATLFWTAWGFLPSNYHVERSLPFEYSDALRFITAIALITRARWAVAVATLWGLSINVMSLLTPDLNYYSTPWLELSFYWFLHIAVFVAAIAFVFGLNYQPGAVDIAITLFATIGWGILCLIINSLTGTNYGYLSHTPEVDSVLNYLGNWPFYIVAEVLLLSIFWPLMAVGLRWLNGFYTSNTRKVMAKSEEESSISPAP